jgi:adhesin transport system membrane fusion protein
MSVATDSALLQLMQRRRPSGWPIAALLIALMIAAFLAWTVVARLDEVAIAQGEVVPLGQNKVVQHFEGGIIKRIYVREGEHVTVDQPLVLIDLGTTGLDSSEIELRLDAHHLKKARLVAELGSDDPSYPANAAARRPQIVESENRTLELRRSQLRTAANSLESQIRSHEAEMADMRRERSALDSGLAVARESLALSDSLIKDNLIPKIHHLERQQEVDRLVAQRHRLDGSLRRAEGELTRARGQLDDLRLTYWREASEELTSVEAEIARLQGGMARANEQQSRTEVRSPIEGVVKGLRYHTLGGVIGPGVPIMEIVPLDDQLLVEARLDPRDIGYVREGQSASRVWSRASRRTPPPISPAITISGCSSRPKKAVSVRMANFRSFPACWRASTSTRARGRCSSSSSGRSSSSGTRRCANADTLLACGREPVPHEPHMQPEVIELIGVGGRHRELRDLILEPIEFRHQGVAGVAVGVEPGNDEVVFDPA